MDDYNISFNAVLAFLQSISIHIFSYASRLFIRCIRFCSGDTKVHVPLLICQKHKIDDKSDHKYRNVRMSNGEKICLELLYRENLLSSNPVHCQSNSHRLKAIVLAYLLWSVPYKQKVVIVLSTFHIYT